MNNGHDIEDIINDTPKLFEIFHNDSSLTKKSPTIITKKYYPFKVYPRFKMIPLPPAEDIKINLKEVFYKRTSDKKFSHEKIQSNEISTLLQYSLGLKNPNQPYTSERFAPSAGKIYPLEAYLFSLSSSLPTATYHYNIKAHGLEILSTNKINDFYPLFSESAAKNASIVICLSSQFTKTTLKYHDRGYRFILMEAGHIAQNILLLAAGLGLSACPIGGFYDSKINNFLHFFPRKEGIVYCIALGKK